MKNLIWDFNGTILDDVEAGYLTVNEMLKQRNKPALKSIANYKKIFGFPIKDYYIRAGFDFKNETYEEIAQCYIPIYNKNARKSKLVKGIDKVLLFCKKFGYRMFILSACEQNMLEEYANKYQISQYFETIYGINDNLASSKETAAKKLFNEIENNDSILIGDSCHDKEIADLFGIKCILVSWGHENFKRLSSANTIVCKTVDDLFNILKEGNL